MQSFALNNVNYLQPTANDVFSYRVETPKKNHNFPKTNGTPEICPLSQDLKKSSYSNGSIVPPRNVDNICEEHTLQVQTNPESKDILNSSSSSSSSDSCSSSSSTSSSSCTCSCSNSSCDSDSTSESDSDSSDSSSSDSSSSLSRAIDSKPNSNASANGSIVNKTISSTNLRTPMVPFAAYKSLSSSARIIEKTKDCVSPSKISPFKSRNSCHTKSNERNGTGKRTLHRFSAPEYTQVELNQSKWNTSASDLMSSGCRGSQPIPTGQESRCCQSAGSEIFQLKMKIIRLNQKEWRVSSSASSSIANTAGSDTNDSQVINECNRLLPDTSNRVISGRKHSLASRDDFEPVHKKRKI